MGVPGSGKSTVAKMLARQLKYRLFSTGDYRGEIALKLGLTIDELNEIGKEEVWTDALADKEVERLGKEEDNLVVDTWLGFHFIPSAAKIFLDIDPAEAAVRVFKHQRPDEQKQQNAGGVQKMLAARYNVDHQRFKKYYGVDIADLTNYDLVIDTTTVTAEAVVKQIMAYLKEQGYLD